LRAWNEGSKGMYADHCICSSPFFRTTLPRGSRRCATLPGSAARALR
jgi:hypothetical protein